MGKKRYTLKKLGEVSNPHYKIKLYLIINDKQKSEKEDNTNRFFTKFQDKATKEKYTEVHVDYDHVFNNLLTYGLPNYSIEALLEHENENYGKTEKDALAFLKVDSNPDKQDAFGAMWMYQTLTNSLGDLSYLKDKYKDEIRENLENAFM